MLSSSTSISRKNVTTCGRHFLRFLGGHSSKTGKHDNCSKAAAVVGKYRITGTSDCRTGEVESCPGLAAAKGQTRAVEHFDLWNATGGPSLDLPTSSCRWHNSLNGCLLTSGPRRQTLVSDPWTCNCLQHLSWSTRFLVRNSSWTQMKVTLEEEVY
jgi:hypothetical protein